MSEEVLAAPMPNTEPEMDAGFVPSTPEEALRIVIRKALECNGLVRGLSQVARSLDRQDALLCVLAGDFEEEEGRRLIEGLCHQNNISIIMVKEHERLAEWAGLVKYDIAGNVKKVFKCSTVCITNFGEPTQALKVIQGKLAE